MGDHKTELAELIRRLDTLKTILLPLSSLAIDGEREKYIRGVDINRAQAIVLLPILKQAIEAEEKTLERFEVSKE